MDTSVFLLISLAALPFTFGENTCTGKTESPNITRFLDESLDLICKEARKDGMDVVRYISETKNPEKHGKFKFASSRWNSSIQNYIKVCNEDHSLVNICLSQLTSYVTNNLETHFVIKSPPKFLNGYYTWCSYEYIHKDNCIRRKQLIILRERIKGYVNGSIVKECRIPKRCNASVTKKVSLNINDINMSTQNVEISPTKTVFACLHPNDSSYHDFCRDHMNSTYVNGSSVIFVFEKTPAFLNNTCLYCEVRFLLCMVNNSLDLNGTTLFLQTEHNIGTNQTTAPNATTSTTEGTTPTTAPNTTTSSNETKTTPIIDKEEQSSWNKQYLWFLVLIPVAISVVVVFLVYRRCSYDDNDQGNMHEMQNLQTQ